MAVRELLVAGAAPVAERQVAHANAELAELFFAKRYVFEKTSFLGGGMAALSGSAEHFQLARKKLAIPVKPKLHNATVGYGNRPHAREAFEPALVQHESRLLHGSALG